MPVTSHGKSHLKSAALICALFACSTSHAVITTFDDRTAFEAAAGVLSTEDFEAFAGQSFAGGAIADLGAFTITQDSTLALYGRISTATSTSIDVNGGVQVNGSVQLPANGGPVFTMTFDNAITAIGFDTTQLNAGNEIYLDGELALATTNPPFNGGDVFVGFVSTIPFTVLTYERVSSSDVFGLDNLAYGGSTQVPEPGGLLLLGLGLLVLGVADRRVLRRRAARINL